MKVRGMKVVGPKLSKDEVTFRKAYLIGLVRLPKKHKKGKEGRVKLKVEVEDVVLLNDAHSKNKKAKSTCVGKSSKRCKSCGVAPNLLRYKGMLGKVHFCCPACGWTSRKGLSWTDRLAEVTIPR